MRLGAEPGNEAGCCVCVNWLHKSPVTTTTIKLPYMVFAHYCNVSLMLANYS